MRIDPARDHQLPRGIGLPGRPQLVITPWETCTFTDPCQLSVTTVPPVTTRSTCSLVIWTSTYGRAGLAGARLAHICLRLHVLAAEARGPSTRRAAGKLHASSNPSKSHMMRNEPDSE